MKLALHLAAMLAAFALGTAWMLCVAAPFMVGVPATWANAPLLLTAAPGFLCFGLGCWAAWSCE